METTLKFAETHELVLDNGDGTITLGISNQAQKFLGDVVFVDLPEIGGETEAGEAFLLVESVKAASDIYSPVKGEVIEINEDLEDSPELVNSDAFGDGWLFKVKLDDASELESLLDAEGYANSIDED